MKKRGSARDWGSDSEMDWDRGDRYMYNWIRNAAGVSRIHQDKTRWQEDIEHPESDTHHPRIDDRSKVARRWVMERVKDWVRGSETNWGSDLEMDWVRDWEMESVAVESVAVEAIPHVDLQAAHHGVVRPHPEGRCCTTSRFHPRLC